MESKSQCIASRKGERCSSIIDNTKRFCDSCAPLCVPSYLKYKRIEQKIKYWPEYETYENMLQYYARLEKARDLRMAFQEKFVHSSAWDEGHQQHMNILNERIKECLITLEYLSSDVIVPEENVEEEIEELKKVVIPKKARNTNRIIQKLPPEVNIFTPLDIIFSYVKERGFARFLVGTLYPLFSYFLEALEEGGPYIRQSPLFKFTSLKTLYLFNEKDLIKYRHELQKRQLPH